MPPPHPPESLESVDLEEDVEDASSDIDFMLGYRGALLEGGEFVVTIFKIFSISNFLLELTSSEEKDSPLLLLPEIPDPVLPVRDDLLSAEDKGRLLLLFSFITLLLFPGEIDEDDAVMATKFDGVGHFVGLLRLLLSSMLSNPSRRSILY